MTRRALAVSARILHGFRRDPRTIVMILVAPLLIMGLFGLALSGEVNDAPVVVVDLDDSDASRALIDAWSDDDAVAVDRVASEDEAEKRVHDAEAWLALVILDGFGARVEAGADAGNASGPLFRLYIDQTDPQSVGAAQEALRAALAAVAPRFGAYDDAIDPVVVYGREDAPASDFLVPALVPFVVFFFATLLTIIVFVRERGEGTLGRVMATPVTPFEVVLGYLLAFMVIAIVQSLVVVGVALALFDTPFEGAVWELFVVVLMIAMAGLGLGTFLSTAAKNELQAVQFIPMVVLPALLLAGVFWPLTSMPVWLRPVAYAIPLTYAVRGARNVMVRGRSFIEEPLAVGLDVWITIGFAFLAVGLAVLVLRRERAA